MSMKDLSPIAEDFSFPRTRFPFWGRLSLWLLRPIPPVSKICRSHCVASPRRSLSHLGVPDFAPCVLVSYAFHSPFRSHSFPT